MPMSCRLASRLRRAPFFKAYVVNLLPGQFVQPYINSAFSDLGLDPATLLPSQLTDPPTGQRATPPLPMPYPRTGQGGQPRQNLPDAITGNPDNHQCGVPGVALPGPGCYPLSTAASGRRHLAVHRRGPPLVPIPRRRRPSRSL